MSDWRPYAVRLADQLQASGDLRTPAWHAAIADTPRHVLVPTVYETQEQFYGSIANTRLNTAEHLELVYSASTSVTAVVPNKYGSVVVVSSSTKPDLTVRMLEALDVGDGRFTERYGAFMVMRQRDNHDGPSLSWQPELPLDRERTTRTPAEPSAVAQFLRSVLSTTPLRHRYTFDEQTRQPVDGVARRATQHYQVARCWIPSSLIMDW